jgi:glycosyltransferase involved in cell wall biosynthesis
MTIRKVHIAVLNSHPIQYFAPLYRYLNASYDVEVTALYLSDYSIRGEKDAGFGQVVKWDIDLLQGYDFHFVRQAAKIGTPHGFFSVVAPDLWNTIRSGKFDVLWLHGHNLAANHVAFASAKSIGMPILMRCETHLGLVRSKVKTAIRRPLLGAFYKSFDGFLAIGSANKAFYLSMDVPNEKITVVPYTVDNERFTSMSQLTVEERKALRREINISESRPAILYASKFMRRKHPDDLLRAAQTLVAEGLEFDLVMVGSGEMEAELKAMAKRLGLSNAVFPGFINQQKLPRIFGACDIFVLPSEDEPWGLVVNEAMCAGLPIIASSEVGCVSDLLCEGENGYSFTTGDIDGLAAALRSLVVNRRLRESQSNKSREIISQWSYRQCLEGLRQQFDRIVPGRGNAGRKR